MEVAADGRGAATLGAGRGEKREERARQKSLETGSRAQRKDGRLKRRTRRVRPLSPSFLPSSSSDPSTPFAHSVARQRLLLTSLDLNQILLAQRVTSDGIASVLV